MKEFWVDFSGWVKVQAETAEEAEKVFWKMHDENSFPWDECDQINIDTIAEAVDN